jgi:CHAD domain-containing protein
MPDRSQADRGRPAGGSRCLAARADPAYGLPVESRHLEVERKYDVDAAFRLPAADELTGLPGVATAAEPVEHLLRAVYFDTADLRLYRGRVTLRRRTGGNDAGWHLKLPAGAARLELHEPLGRAAKKPPASLLVPVAGLLRGAQVSPVATLQTRRVVTELRDGGGRVLAELADDTVTATVLAAGADEPLEIQTWREVEVELVEGSEPLLAAVGEHLSAAGAQPSPRASKLGRALAARLRDPEAPRQRKRRAGSAVMEAIRAEVAALQAADVQVRSGQPDGAHQIRVAGRKLRSLLAVFRSVLDRTATDPLRVELSWLAGELATARDDDVALAHLRAVVATQPVELVLGPVAARLQQTALKAAESGRVRATATLSDARYLRLLDDLHDLLDAPPLLEGARRGRRPAMRAAVRRAARRLDRQLEAVGRLRGQGREEDLEEALHEARKAVKRLRYTTEAAVAELGRPARKLVRMTQKAQETLGERQDTVATRERCGQLALAAQSAGENAFTYGRLHALEESRAARASVAFEALESRLRPVLAEFSKR